MLIVLFSIMFPILPSGGMMTIASEMSAVARVADIARHLVLPAMTLGLFYVAVYARLMRASMLEVYTFDFITDGAREGHCRKRASAFVHAARNALLPVVTLAGVQIGHLLGGSILVETVFGWPGLGRLVFDALLQRDLNLLLGILFISSVDRRGGEPRGRSDLRPAGPADRAQMSGLAEYWQRFRRNRAAVVALGLLGAIVTGAVIGPFVYPVDPFEMMGRPSASPRQDGSCLERMCRAATSSPVSSMARACRC